MNCKVLRKYLNNYSYSILLEVILGNLTIVLKDDVEEELRRISAELYGSRRGSLSACIEDALKHWILEVKRKSIQAREEKYVASKNGKEVARADSLGELGKMLREMKLDPRTVEIVSTIPLEETVRAGLRAKAK